jgi:hypothetical protein
VRRFVESSCRPRSLPVATARWERLRRGDYYCRRLGVHLSWVADLRGWWDETDFHETRDTGFLLARLEQLWPRVPRAKPLSVGVVLRLMPTSGAGPNARGDQPECVGKSQAPVPRYAVLEVRIHLPPAGSPVRT